MPVADDFRARLREVLACPTGPLHEQRVHAVIRAAARASPRLRDRIDRYGNLEVVYGKGRPELFFALLRYGGFRAGALCLALRNHHNHRKHHNHGRDGMAPESVHADDAENLVEWMTAFAREHGRRDARARALKRLDRLWRRHRGRLVRTAERAARGPRPGKSPPRAWHRTAVRCRPPGRRR